MAFNGSGTFNRVHSWATDKTNTVAVTASRMDAEDDGFATGLTTCITKDGQTTTTARIPFASGVSAAAGTVSGVSYGLTNDLDTGLYFPAANSWGLSAGGTETLRSTATAVTLTGTLAVSGASTLTGAVTASSTLALTGAATLSSTLAVTGAATLSSTLAVTGAATLSSTLAVTGTATFTSTLNANDNVNVNTNKFNIVAASGNTTIAGTLGVTGASTFAAVSGTSGTFTAALSGATAAGAMVATQAEMETGTATDKVTVPGRQHFHKSAVQAWCNFAGTTGTIRQSYNITSVVRDSAGSYTITIANDFASDTYAIAVGVGTTDNLTHRYQNQAAGTFEIVILSTGGTPTDPTTVSFICSGDLP